MEYPGLCVFFFGFLRFGSVIKFVILLGGGRRGRLGGLCCGAVTTDKRFGLFIYGHHTLL